MLTPETQVHSIPFCCFSLQIPQNHEKPGKLSCHSPIALTPLLTDGAQCDQWVLPRADVLVIGPVSIHVGGTVDQPGDIEWDGIAKDRGQEVGVPQTLSPDTPGHQCGDHEAHEHHGDLIVPGRQGIMLSLGTCWWRWGKAEQAIGQVRNCDVQQLPFFLYKEYPVVCHSMQGPRTHIPTRCRRVTQIWELRQTECYRKWEGL